MGESRLAVPDNIIPPQYRDVIDRIADVVAELSLRIAKNDTRDPRHESANSDRGGGDVQKALDVIADEAFCAALAGSQVKFLASEEQEEALTLNPQGNLALAIDPLDGSSNIDVNAPIGSIFALYPAEESPEDSFLRPGFEMCGAGYAVYGPQCFLILTFGEGVQKYLLDPETRCFHLVEQNLSITRKSWEFAINASNYRHWSRPIRVWVDDCTAGATGPREKNFNMRWLASLVGETHRILTRGGVFLYPADSRRGYERGRLRYLYECAPIAFIIEQAGGQATDALNRTLDHTPRSLHERSPFVFGSADNVARVAAYHDLPEAETTALFSNRSLFRM
ncbi:class 1 fructose-bisphosphatase [Xanthobacter sp. TB0139]|uniref:class 1 fructose-bisphosphatase n=1 Tax=Xanthobacter sp. TB0139 TaxID=3459178 RepID=UPI004039E447